jgi:arylsulfatase A-like enzyme
MEPITRRDAVKAVIGGALAAPAILHGYRRGGDKPNLLFLWTDQQRANTLAVYGNRGYHVPVMNELASRSIVLGRCYDSQPICTPARSTVMTGSYPHQNGCVNNGIPLRRETKAVPELLNDSAYRTGYMGKWHLGDEGSAQHGFQEWVSMERKGGIRTSYHDFLAQLGYKPDSETDFSREFAARLPFDHGKPAFLAGRASEFIMKNRREPWMLYVNFLEPHPPYFGPLRDLHSDTEAPLPPNYGPGVEREPVTYQRKREAPRHLTDEELGLDVSPSEANSKEGRRDAFRVLNRYYAGNCSNVDHALGRILWALEASGQADNTIIAFTTDHGEMGGAHSLAQKSVMYEEAIHVPMLLRVPWRQSRQIVVPQPVGHIDLVPTILELMQGKPAPESLPGESWLGLLAGKARREDHVFIEWKTDKDVRSDARTAISPDGWKLVLYEKDNCMLFNRNRDPLEMSNLYYRSEHRATVRKLRNRIQKWQEQQRDTMPLPEPA